MHDCDNICSSDNEEGSPLLSKIVLNAAAQVSEEVEGKDGLRVDLDNIKVEKKAGGAIRDMQLVKGIVLDKEVVHSGMPKRVERAKIALINSALEIEKTEMSAEIRISDPQQTQRFLDEENHMLKSMVDKITSAGANIIWAPRAHKSVPHSPSIDYFREY
jgi:chaperonin GroEL (HSP60 family)